MYNQLDLKSILLTNTMGFVLLLLASGVCIWLFDKRQKQSHHLQLMIIFVGLACICDGLSSICDGRAGTLYYYGVLIGNSALYMIYMVVGLGWLYFLVYHLNASISSTQKYILELFVLIGFILIIINIFNPIIFSISENNVYNRGPLYFYYLTISHGYLIYSLVIYFQIRKKSKNLKFFPVWVFIAPTILGAIIQTFIYGVSTICPFAAISVVGLILSLQGETIFRDKLTGLFNRYYFEYLKQQLKVEKKLNYTAIMIDINDFKSINDTFGHLIGDEALKNTADILISSICCDGEVIRYAGDEFIILLPTQDDEKINATIDKINSFITTFNASKKAEYTITLSMGFRKLDLSTYTIEALMDDVDKLMYENKKSFYINHPEASKRKN